MPVIWVCQPETLVQRLSAYCAVSLSGAAFAAGRRQQRQHGRDGRCGDEEGALGVSDLCHAATMLLTAGCGIRGADDALRASRSPQARSRLATMLIISATTTAANR